MLGTIKKLLLEKTLDNATFKRVERYLRKMLPISPLWQIEVGQGVGEDAEECFIQFQPRYFLARIVIGVNLSAEGQLRGLRHEFLHLMLPQGMEYIWAVGGDDEKPLVKMILAGDEEQVITVEHLLDLGGPLSLETLKKIAEQR